MGNGSKTGGSGQLGENGGAGSAKPLEGGTQSTNNRGGVGGNNQKSEGATEKPLTPPTHKNEKKKAAPLTNNEQKKVDDFAKKMTGKGVNLIDKAEDLPKSEGTAYRAIKDGYKVMGWFNIKTGQVYIYTPNARNYNEVMKTLLHEFVSHKGLRDMLGAKKFDELCRNVWKMMPYEQRLQYAVYVTKNIAIGSRKMQAYIKNLSLYESAALLGNEQVQLAAADEYMAHFAEKGITEQNRSLWKTITDAIRDLLRKIGFDVPLRDSDIARLLYESKNRLTQDMSLEEMTNTITNLNGTNSIGGQVGNRTQNATRFSIYENQDIAKLNDQFNADIERYIRNETPRGFRFELGHPSAYLISAGFPNLPITLRSALLARKAGDNKHPFEASEIRDLVKAIQKPIAIFNYSKDNMRNLIVDTVHNGKHFLIGVTLGYKSGELEVNSVSGMFPKESHEWIKWIQDGKAIRIDQKEKVQDLINSLRTNPAESERIGLNLDLAAKIVQNFENPKLPEDTGIRFSISDDESLEFHKVIDQMFDDAQFNNGQHQRERYNIGKTPEWMKKVGITGEEFSLSFKNIKVHRGKDVDHDLTREEWHALPSALKNPFVVTRYKGADDRFRLYVNIYHNGKPIAVGVDVKRVNQGKGKPMLDVNSIKTVFAHSGEIGISEVLVAYDERITPEQEALLHGLNFREYPTIQELSAAKVGTNFETTKENGENLSNNNTRFSIAEAEQILSDGSSHQSKRYNPNPDIRFSITKRNEVTIDNLLAKNKNITPNEVAAFKRFVDEYPPVAQLAMARWYGLESVRLPADKPLVDNALKICNKTKKDPMSYTSPGEICEEYRKQHIEENAPKRELLKPEAYPEVFTNKVDYGNGIVVYDVENSKRGQQAVRDLMNDHLGKTVSPWCLLYANNNGELTEHAWEMWQYYDRTQKKIALYNGQIVSFCASELESSQWWDLSDASHGEAIPIEGKIPNDKMGRSSMLEFDTETKESTPVGSMYLGNKKEGKYYKWDLNGDLSAEENYKHEKLDGECRYWDNGQLSFIQSYKNGQTSRSVKFYLNGDGAINWDITYIDGKKRSEKRWFSNGQLSLEKYYKDGLTEGLCRTWYKNGQLENEWNCKANKLDGPYRTWYENGQLDTEKHYKDNKDDGLFRRWYRNGQLHSERNYINDCVEGVEKGWHENGQLWYEGNYKKGHRDGLFKEWDEEGQLLSETEYKNGYPVSSIRFSISNDERQGELSQEELHERVRTYDENNGTELGRFVDFIERGRSLNEGEKSHFKVAVAGDLLQQYGIKGNIYTSTRTINPNYHSNNADHGLTSSEWLEAMESINNPLAITSYRGLQDNYRVYTYAIKNGKSICLGMEVKRNGNGVEISNIEEYADIRTAFGRDIENAINNERILYPEGSNAVETIRRNFAQSSEGHNSLLYEQNSVYAAKVGTNFETTKENGENLSENNNTRFSISSYAPETDNTLTETARQEMQTIHDEAIANGTYMKAPNGKSTHLNESQWLQVRTQAFKEWFGDWELAAKANAIQALQAIKATPHSMSRKELESVYKNLPSVTKGNTTISFYGNTFGKNYRENGLFAKAVPVLDKVLDNAVLAYRETDNRAGELRKDGTVHKPHRNIESYDNYIGKVELDGKEYYVRFTVANEKGESGVHSQFVSNVELYNNSTKNASGLDLTLQSRLVLDGITDAKLQQFFESAKSAEQNCSKADSTSKCN